MTPLIEGVCTPYALPIISRLGHAYGARACPHVIGSLTSCGRVTMVYAGGNRYRERIVLIQIGVASLSVSHADGIWDSPYCTIDSATALRHPRDWEGESDEAGPRVGQGRLSFSIVSRPRGQEERPHAHSGAPRLQLRQIYRLPRTKPQAHAPPSAPSAHRQTPKASE